MTTTVERSISPDLARSQGASPVTSTGRTLYGHFTVFDTWYEVHDWEGRFLERIARGALADTIRGRMGEIRVQYDHGHDPATGSLPLGKLIELREDERGGYFEVELLDTERAQDVAKAAREGLLGASFRFSVVSETWSHPAKATAHNPAKLPERTITGLDLWELGPVVYGANPAATVGVRSRSLVPEAAGPHRPRGPRGDHVLQVCRNGQVSLVRLEELSKRALMRALIGVLPRHFDSQVITAVTQAPGGVEHFRWVHPAVTVRVLPAVQAQRAARKPGRHRALSSPVEKGLRKQLQAAAKRDRMARAIRINQQRRRRGWAPV